MYGGYYFKPYVSVAEKSAKAKKKIAQLRRQGLDIKPIEAFTGAIAKTFWGKNWCKNLESFADYENRLGRGRSYVRNGFICHLEIKKGVILAKVNGSSLYDVKINIKTLDAKRWQQICDQCQGQISSLVELLEGKFSKGLMSIVSDPETGIYPKPDEIKCSCSCPDYASLCKHIAAVLYAIGRRLDTEPELLFTLRGVDPTDLLPKNIAKLTESDQEALEIDDMGALFDIDLESDDLPPANSAPISQDKDQEKAPKSPIINPQKLTGSAVKKLQKLSGLSIESFAEALNVSVFTAKRWLSTSGTLRLRKENLASLLAYQEKILNK